MVARLPPEPKTKRKGERRWLGCGIGGATLRKGIIHEENAVFSPLYSMLVQIAEDTVQNAQRHDLYVFSKKDATTVIFSTFGVLMIMDREKCGANIVVKTVFLPGCGDPSYRTDNDSPVAAAGTKAKIKPSDYSRRPGTREYRERSRREKKYSTEEALFYKVVKIAVQFIRRQSVKEYVNERKKRGTITRF